MSKPGSHWVACLLLTHQGPQGLIAASHKCKYSMYTTHTHTYTHFYTAYMYYLSHTRNQCLLVRERSRGRCPLSRINTWWKCVTQVVTACNLCASKRHKMHLSKYLKCWNGIFSLCFTLSSLIQIHTFISCQADWLWNLQHMCFQPCIVLDSASLTAATHCPKAPCPLLYISRFYSIHFHILSYFQCHFALLFTRLSAH